MNPLRGDSCLLIIEKYKESQDGVQAIDDEFLEWFVKNPSCESVETERFVGL